MSIAKLSRRGFIQAASLAGAGSFLSGARKGIASSPISHILVCCNENRSFDHYYGYAPFAGVYGVPAGYTQPNGTGGTVTPHHLKTGVTMDPAHDWDSIHAEWDGGLMDGFYTTNGSVAVGYYDQSDLPFYYSLIQNFSLCASYFCSVLGPTYPNRLYLAGATCGGNTTNTIAPGSLTYPIILDLLDAYGITWKVYHIGPACEVGTGACDNEFQFFANWWQDPRVNIYGEPDYISDLNTGNLPQVSFLSTSDINGEHPPASARTAQQVQQRLMGALMASSAWASSAYVFTYDEGGGFFDHVLPPVFDAYGAGIRVPTWIISPYSKPGHVEGTQYEHSSILKFIESTFGLPTLASINHAFDYQTPALNNQAAGNQPYGPPAAPRDGRADIGNLLECLSFG